MYITADSIGRIRATTRTASAGSGGAIFCRQSVIGTALCMPCDFAALLLAVVSHDTQPTHRPSSDTGFTRGHAAPRATQAFGHILGTMAMLTAPSTHSRERLGSLSRDQRAPREGTVSGADKAKTVIRSVRARQAWLVCNG
jgi:hypothetical protein